MKTKSLLFHGTLISLSMIAATAMAQDVPNGDFSSWETRSIPTEYGGGSYSSPSGYWDCTNILNPACAKKVEGRTSGSSAIELTSQTLDLTPFGMSTYTTSMVSMNDYLKEMSNAEYERGVPCTRVPARYLTFWYKYQPQCDDNARVYIEFDASRVIVPNVTISRHCVTDITEATSDWTFGYVDLSSVSGIDWCKGYAITISSSKQTGDNAGINYSTGGSVDSKLTITDLKFSYSSTPTEMEIAEESDAFKWTGTNKRTNAKYVLGAINGNPDNAFFLELSRVDAASAAQVDEEMEADPNYWETFFSNYTEFNIGEAMTTTDNVKQLAVSGVALAANQFSGYEEIETITLDGLNGAYSIPDGCFANMDGEHHHLTTITCNNMTSITLGSGILTGTTGSNLVIETANESVAKTWYDYKTANSCSYTVYLDGTEYVPTGVEAVSAEKQAKGGAAYNIAGQKVSDGYQDIVIKDGKKVIK